MVDFNNCPPTAALFDRMQNLNLNADGNKAKFYHYCYVCNTQLNSCKQALLHCSGKRHRKKLQFLQSRNNATSHITPGSSAFPSTIDQNSNGFIYPIPTGYHPVHANFNYPADTAVLPPLPAPLPITPVPPPFYPPVMAAGHSQHHHATSQGHDHWLPSTMMTPYHHNHNHHHPTAPSLPHAHHMLPIPPALPPPLFPNPVNNSLMLPDANLRSSSSYSDSTRSGLVSPPSATSSLSSEPFSVNRCHVCQRKFANHVQLQAHLQTARHYKSLAQSPPCYEVAARKAADGSETDSSYVSTSSIYFCALCNVDISNIQSCCSTGHHVESDPGNSKVKSRSLLGGATAHRHPSRSSSTSSEPIEIVVDSGYVSGSGDELICVSHPTPDKPTAKFRCQLCNTFLNSPAQAKQHLSSQKHLLRVNDCRRPVFRRRSCNSFKKKHTGTYQSVPALCQADQTAKPPDEQENVVSDNCDSSSLLSPEPDSDVATLAAVENAICLPDRT